MNGIEIFLDSIRFSPPGGRWSFMWNKGQSSPFAGGIGFEFFIEYEKRNRASLIIAKNNSDFLSGFSIQKVSDLLSKFFVYSIEDLGVADSFLMVRNRNQSVLGIVSKAKLHGIEEKFRIFLKKELQKSIFCMPVSGIHCFAEKSKGDFMWVPNEFDLEIITQELENPQKNLEIGKFPPLKDWEYKRYPLTKEDSWFLVKARDESVAESYFRILTGALSVVLEYPQSRMITGRQMIDGRIEFRQDGSCGFNHKVCTVPAVSLPIKLKSNSSDVFWSLCNSENGKRVQTSLEFLAESWGKSRVISFINASIAMDALFGANGRVRKSILIGIEKHCSETTDAKDKYDLILKIRNDILHGDVSSLETSPHYLAYYEKFNKDPANEQISILNECLISVSRVHQ